MSRKAEEKIMELWKKLGIGEKGEKEEETRKKR